VPDHPGEGGLMLLARAFLDLLGKQSERCGAPCFPLSGGSYSCGREKGHDGLHASLYGNGATWDGNIVTEGLLLAPLPEQSEEEACAHGNRVSEFCPQCPDGGV